MARQFYINAPRQRSTRKSATPIETRNLLDLGENSDVKFRTATLSPYERHKQIPAELVGNPSNQPTQGAVDTAPGLVFASTGTEYAFGEWEIPDDWDGNDIYIEVDWCPYSGAMSGTDTIKWNMDYRAITEGDTLNAGTLASLSVTDSTDYAQYETKHTQFTLAANDANQPLTAQDHIYFRITRDTGVANDFAGTVMVTAFEIVYTSTSIPTN